jgi:kinesin family protein 18/19
MIANINPSNTTYEDSHNTLKYSNRAKNIKVNPSMKETKQDSTWMEREQRLREENNALKIRIAELEAIIEGFQNGVGVTSIPQLKMDEEIVDVNTLHDDNIEVCLEDVDAFNIMCPILSNKNTGLKFGNKFDGAININEVLTKSNNNNVKNNGNIDDILEGLPIKLAYGKIKQSKNLSINFMPIGSLSTLSELKERKKYSNVKNGKIDNNDNLNTSSHKEKKKRKEKDSDGADKASKKKSKN